ncbi:hypothetical protein Y032_0139g2147 [Ancylostoma ceylanicum]|uniref:Uncharacterized protein n=1 Tax=Ancylostoma ceylanicum TaxID=53326 RepID=A0A016T4Z6_9BILA|nr:hypothetical protein Y032_0139g2147 [Ancylostoma ceylanicum]
MPFIHFQALLLCEETKHECIKSEVWSGAEEVLSFLKRMKYVDHLAYTNEDEPPERFNINEFYKKVYLNRLSDVDALSTSVSSILFLTACCYEHY